MYLNNGQIYLLGSASSCDLEVHGEGVSPRHCRVMVGGGLVTIEDLGTGGNTRLNGQPIHLASIHFGDHFRLGRHVLRLDARSDLHLASGQLEIADGECVACGGPIFPQEFARTELRDKFGRDLCCPCIEEKRVVRKVGTRRIVGPGRADPVSLPESVGGRFAIVSRRGAGPLGVVYEGWDVQDNVKVAVKILASRFREDPVSFARLGEAGKNVMLLDHPWVARPIRLGDDPAGCYLVSEYIDGIPLWQTIDERGPFPVEEALQLGVVLADALDLIHDRGLVHGDLKPSNLLVVAENRIKITDACLARACLGTGPDLASFGLSPRTLAYLAPELLAESSEADVLSDLYSLGAVLYTLLAGAVPFDDLEPEILFDRIRRADWIPLRQVCPEVPESVERVVARAMAPGPADRFETASEMGEALMEAWMSWGTSGTG
jgi:hypothetical protein